ncbi:MAG: PD-(D/E)XK motif protein [Acidobacteria bacterium]|nr:PD-(D/E)XK motif protein [Acidobacteriota bacterium]
MASLDDIFDAIAPPEGGPDKPIYAVTPLPGHESYFVGKDREGHACLLVTAAERAGKPTPPIRLENLDVQFELRCFVKRNKEAERTGVFTVIRCRSLEKETTRYFLSVCNTIVGLIGDKPQQREVASAVHRLAAIFQRMQRPPARPVNGLFGELYVIWRSANPVRAVAAWRVDETARFDFSEGDIRIDVKVTAGRVRTHTFSYEQCNPPPGTMPVVASLFAEQSPDGISLRHLMREIEAKITAHPDLVLKLHEVVSATLGGSLGEALAMAFDRRLAESSLRFYNLREVPAIRGPLSAGVSDVHFRSDLSGLSAMAIHSLIEQNDLFRSLLPRKA